MTIIEKRRIHKCLFLLSGIFLLVTYPAIASSPRDKERIKSEYISPGAAMWKNTAFNQPKANEYKPLGGHPNEEQKGWDVLEILTFVSIIVIAIQVYLLWNQIRVFSLLDLEKEWNSDYMVKLRALAFVKNKKSDKLGNLEGVLEFLEKLSSFKRFRIFGKKFVWDSTLGWYAFRYYYYNRAQIPMLRNKWRDDRLYLDLENLYNIYLEMEISHSRKSCNQIIKDLEKTRNHFIRGEKGI